MKTYQERTKSIQKKAKALKDSQKAWITVGSLCLVAIICCSVIIPVVAYSPDGVNPYSQSPYFAIIEQLDKLQSSNKNYGEIFYPDVSLPAAPEGSVGLDSATNAPGGNEFVETTLNQVDGVAEADLLKRNQTHAFYLVSMYQNGTRYFVLNVISINKEQSKLESQYTIQAPEGMKFSYGAYEMFLNSNSQLTIFLPIQQNGISYTNLVSLNVSDPQNVSEVARVYVSGTYSTARRVGDEILLVTNFVLPYNVDYADEYTYVPACGTSEDINKFDMAEIEIGPCVTQSRYSVVTKFKEEDLSVVSRRALFSYSEQIYVSQNYLFSTLAVNTMQGNVCTLQTQVTYLTYKDGIYVAGSVLVDGGVKDRFCLDEKDNILRVVATEADRWNLAYDGGFFFRPYTYVSKTTTASLYCFDLTSGQQIVAIENFAPEYESVRSARFQGDTLYVCTAVGLKDPVFAFDLSDINNVTYKQTGEIPGFSISLVPFGDTLLGIGYGDSGSELKIELYRQTETDVVSVDACSLSPVSFSQDVKSHFVDAERQLIGLSVINYGESFTTYQYMVWHFDGEKLQLATAKELQCAPELTRAFYDDGIYVFSTSNLNPVTYISPDMLTQ